MCICMPLNSYVHLIPLTLPSQTKSNQNNDGSINQDNLRQRKVPTTEFPAPTTLNRQYSHGHSKQYYGHADHYNSSTADTAPGNICLPPSHQELCCHRVQEQENYPILSPTSLIFKQKTCKPFVICQLLRPLTLSTISLKLTTRKYLLPFATHHTSSKTWTPSGYRQLSTLADSRLHPHTTHQQIVSLYG